MLPRFINDTALLKIISGQSGKLNKVERIHLLPLLGTKSLDALTFLGRIGRGSIRRPRSCEHGRDIVLTEPGIALLPGSPKLLLGVVEQVDNLSILLLEVGELAGELILK